MEKLTNRQREFFEMFKEFKKRYIYTPTIREFGEYVGYNSPATTKFYLDVLEKKGYIRRINNRNIEIIGDYSENN